MAGETDLIIRLLLQDLASKGVQSAIDKLKELDSTAANATAAQKAVAAATEGVANAAEKSAAKLGRGVKALQLTAQELEKIRNASLFHGNDPLMGADATTRDIIAAQTGNRNVVVTQGALPSAPGAQGAEIQYRKMTAKEIANEQAALQALEVTRAQEKAAMVERFNTEQAMLELQRQEQEALRGTANATNAMSQAELDNVNATYNNLEAQERQIAVLKKAQTEAMHTQAEWRRVQFVGRGMVEIAQTFQVASKAAMDAMTASAEAFVKGSTASSAVVKDWRTSTDQLAVSQSRVGAIIAKEALPALQESARLANQIANFVEANPGAVDFALKATGVVLTVSTIGLALAKGFRIYADVGYMLATQKELTASAIFTAAVHEHEKAIAAFAAAVAVNSGSTATNAVVETAAPAAGGFGLGSLLGGGGLLAGIGAVATAMVPLIPALLLLAAALWEARDRGIDLGDVTKKTVIISFSSMIATFQAVGESIKNGTPYWDEFNKAAQSWIITMGQATGVLADPATAVGSKAYLEMFAKNNAQLWVDYEKQVADATKEYGKKKVDLENEYEKERTKIVEDSAAERVNIEAKYAKDLSKLDADYADKIAKNARDFQKAEVAKEDDYWRKRAELAAAYNLEVQRNEEDHRKEMRRMLEDHQTKEFDLVIARDAFGFMMENRNYEKERSRAEEDYAIEARRRSEDFALKLAAMVQDGIAERAQRLRDFRQKQIDLAKDYADRKKELADQRAEQLKVNEADRIKALDDLKKANAEKLAVMRQAYNDQLQAFHQAFVDRIRAIDAAILSDYNAFQQEMVRMHDAFVKWLEDAKNADYNPNTAPGAGHAANGGYVGRGLYHMGEVGDEFVLTNRTTRMLESGMGRLTQGGILAGMSGRGSNLTLNFDLAGGRLTEMHDIVAQSKSEILELIGRALEI